VNLLSRSAHQRFFKELTVCAKVPFIANDALKQIREGRCVVIGLQSTGDAGMQSLLEEGKKTSILNEAERFTSLVSTVSTCLSRFIEDHFPTRPSPPEVPKLPTEIPCNDLERQQYRMVQAEIARIQLLPPPRPIPVLLQRRQALLDAIRYLDLPPNPLDDLIDRLGGPDQVAEMTGRPGRVVRVPNSAGDYFVYSKRLSKASTTAAAAQEDSERINTVERRLFMEGKKSVAIISDAASTGVSLHAANGSGAQHKRRVHYTIELPWSADKVRIVSVYFFHRMVWETRQL
jgi:hypothetical protein